MFGAIRKESEPTGKWRSYRRLGATSGQILVEVEPVSAQIHPNFMAMGSPFGVLLCLRLPKQEEKIDVMSVA